MTVPNIKLNNGHSMPQVGFGLWKVANETCADTVYNAIKVGYRLLDGACDYGNEKEAGEGVARAIKDGLVKREELFIVSKLWNSFHDADQVEPICRKQLADWGVDYFDLYVIHFPIALKYVDPAVRYPPGWNYSEEEGVQLSNASIESTWHAMEDLVGKGLTKTIGISNMQGSLILDMLRYAKIRPATLQIEHHPYLVQPTLLQLAKSEGIAVTAYSSFGPQSFIELEWQKAKDTPVLFEHPVVTKIAEKHNRTPAQTLLRWSTQRGLGVIPKSNNPDRLKQNLEVTDFDLEQSEIDAITGLDRGLRFNNPTDYLGTLHIFA
ncbi:putative D-xylose reductase [Venustampulla echinocandica]|uniref:Putative D-xylose reductase n=1 Tax=Venustampulla echinocandica TaxID=2656787 RepID=A0A370U3S6_9HELO|nr:putative D-xylose reductase [Venustampulla echinocandica]RDL42437.1 putative D-xylose reductase [Venustampulla echinocandica]